MAGDLGAPLRGRVLSRRKGLQVLPPVVLGSAPGVAAAHGVAGDADAAVIDIIQVVVGVLHQGDHPHPLRGAGIALEIVGTAGITVVIGVHSHHGDPPAGKLDGGDILHLVVIQVAVAGDDQGDGVIRRGGHRAEEIAGHPLAVVGGDGEFGDLHPAEVGLQRRRPDAADQHQDDGHAEEPYRCFGAQSLGDRCLHKHTLLFPFPSFLLGDRLLRRKDDFTVDIFIR